jgi:hypothetical protein
MAGVSAPGRGLSAIGDRDTTLQVTAIRYMADGGNRLRCARRHAIPNDGRSVGAGRTSFVVSTMVDDYVQTLVPAQYDRSKVGKRRPGMEAAVAGSSLEGGGWFESGSWAHGTALKGHSDVDFMIPASGSRPVRSSSALSTLKAALKGSNWEIWDLGISSPTVKVRFMSAPHFEVVPAWYCKTVRGDKVYWIPAPGDGWAESAPGAHLRFVSEQNDRLGKRVKPLARLLKQWKVHAGAPVSSFYLEMRTAEYAKGENSIFYHLDLKLLMSRLIDCGLRSMNDPTGLVSRISGVSSEENRGKALRLLREAKGHLDAAYELDGKPGLVEKLRYLHHMKAVFGEFPCPTW